MGGSLVKLLVLLFLEVESTMSDANASSPEDRLTTYLYNSDGMPIRMSQPITTLRIANQNDPAESAAEQVQLEDDLRSGSLSGPGPTARPIPRR